MPKIAVIEDVPAINDDHRRMLETLPDVQVFQAYNYQGARELILREKPDLLIVDIDLGGPIPGKHEGFELLREFGPNIPSIVVTGMPEANLRTISLTLKAYEFISKPADGMDFLNKVNHALAFAASAVGRSTAREALWPKDLEVDPTRPPHLLWKKKPVALTGTELTLVHYLAERPGEVVSYSKLASAMKSGESSRALSSHMTGVRKKFLAVDGAFDAFDAVPKKGYLWKTDD